MWCSKDGTLIDTDMATDTPQNTPINAQNAMTMLPIARGDWSPRYPKKCEIGWGTHRQGGAGINRLRWLSMSKCQRDQSTRDFEGECEYNSGILLLNLPAVNTVELSGHAAVLDTYSGLRTQNVQHYHLIKRSEETAVLHPHSRNLLAFLSPIPPQLSISADYCLFRSE